MSLLVWYPLDGNLKNYGCVADAKITTTVDPNFTDGKVTSEALSTGAGYWTAAQTAKIFNADAMSFAFWLYVPAGASGDSVFFGTSGMTPPNNRRFSMFQYPNPTTLHLSWQSTTGTGADIFGGTWQIFEEAKWTHCVVTYSRKDKKVNIYKNGTLFASNNLTNTYTEADTWDNQTNVFYNNNLKYLNDFRIYNNVLSEKEIKDLAKGLSTHYNFNYWKEYISCNYIQGDGTQYINTGVGQTTTSTIDCHIYVPNSQRNYLFGAQQSSGSMLYNGIYNNSALEYNYLDVPFTAASDITMTQRIAGSNTNITINGVTSTVATGTSSDSGNIYIFACRYNTGGLRLYGNTMRLYYFKMYENNVLVRDFEPVVRRSDMEPGLFDHVNGVFYSDANSSDTKFTYEVKNDYITDVAGYRHNGDLYNVTMDSEIKTGSHSAYFNGSNSRIYSTLDIKPEMTYAVWLKFHNSNSCHILDARIPSPEEGIQPIYAGVNYGLQFYTTKLNEITGENEDATLNWSAAECGFTVDNWYHVAVVQTATTATLYINGNKISTKSGNCGWNLGEVPFNIGCRCTQANWFNGWLSDLRVYQSTLTDEDIANIYKSRLIIDNTANVYSEVYSEGETTQVLATENAVKAIPELAECVVTADGAIYMPICMHYVPKGLFDTTGDYTKPVYKSENIWSNFSLINTVERYESDYWEFLVRQQGAVNGTFSTYRFKQNVSPMSATWEQVNPNMVGTNVFAVGGSSIMGGMYWYNTTNCKMCFPNTNKGNWYGCAIAAYNGTGYIPGYGNQQTAGYQLVYMRISELQFKQYQSGMLLVKDIKEF